MTTNFKGLLFAAAVAMLPVACGTSAPTGMDVAAIEADGHMSALRSDLPVPPQAPEPQSPNPDSIPLPADPETGVDPVSDPPQAELPSNRPNRPAPGTDPVPVPPSIDPVPAPSTGDPNDPAPSAAPNSGPRAPTSVELPAAPVSGGGTIPTPPIVPSPAPNSGAPTSVEIPPAPNSGPRAPTSVEIPAAPVSDGGTIPAPIPVPVPEECQAVSIEIVSVSTTIAEPRGAGFIALLTDRDGRLIEDASCEKLAWQVVGGVNDNRIVISYGDNNSRVAYVLGMTGGTYTIRATTPNNLTATLVVGAR